MKFTLPLLTLLLGAVIANPVAEPEAEPEPEPEPEALDFTRAERGSSLNERDNVLEKRAYSCTITGSDVRCRTGPGTNYPAPGQYSGGPGQKITISSCKKGQNVDGTPYWDRIASGPNSKCNGYYISEAYLSCNGYPAC